MYSKQNFSSFILLFIVVVFTQFSYAETFNVNNSQDDVDVSVGDGVCRTGNNQCSLRAAIQEANAMPGPDVIRVPAGTYQMVINAPGEDFATAGDYDILDDVQIIGSGRESTVINGVRLDRIFYVAPRTVVTISDMTLQNGLTRGGDGAEQTGLGRGGGLLNFGQTTLSSVAIVNNIASDSGAGVANVGVDAILQMNDVVFSGNSIEVGSFGDSRLGSGGAISNEAQAKMVLKNATLSNNTAGNGGGGLYNGFDSEVWFNDVAVVNNSATDGGGILNKGTLMLNRVLLANNSADNGGGIVNAMLVGEGEVRPISIPSAMLMNVTITNNLAFNLGGAIFNRGAVIELLHVTIANNVAEDNIGGIFSGSSQTTETILKGTLLSQNTSGQDSSEKTNCVGDTFISADYNLSDDDTCSNFLDERFDLNDIDAQLDELSDEVGSLQAHPLLPGSPAIDVIPLDDCDDYNTKDAVVVDQRGGQRPNSGACDIGAYENGASPATELPDFPADPITPPAPPDPPDEPPDEPEEPEVISIEQALDTNQNGVIDDSEIKIAITYWVDEFEIPGTGGQIIDDAKVKELIEMWALQLPIS